MSDAAPRRQRRRRPARRDLRRRGDDGAPHAASRAAPSTALAAHRAYRGAGVVLRCPACADVAVRIGVSDRALVFEWRGTLDRAAPGT